MSMRRRIAQALAKAARETLRDAGTGAVAGGAVGAATKGDVEGALEDAGRGAAFGAAAGRALRSSVFRRTGNAGPISAVRRSAANGAPVPAPKGGRYSRPEEHAERLGPNAKPRAEARTGNAEPVSSVKPRRSREPEFEVSTKAGGVVNARRATSEGAVTTSSGAKLKYKPGDMIVTYGPGDQAVVRGDIFRDTYRKVGPGQYAKREGVKMRAAVAKRARNVRTLEGPARAEEGDVIMRGTRGERWPVPRDKFNSKYNVHF